MEEITESILEIASEFATDEEVALMSKSGESNRLTILVYLWAVKEASRKAIGPEICSMKELSLQEIRKTGEYFVTEIDHQLAGFIRSVTFRNNNYVYAVSLSNSVANEY